MPRPEPTVYERLAAPPDLVTDFEKSGGMRTPTYAETAAYLARLDAAADWVRVGSYGRTPEGRDMQLVVVDRHGRFAPEKAHTAGNVVVLVQAGIHAGEIDGTAPRYSFGSSAL